ncbi:MAG: polyprenyl synthetase family protein [Candidatus Saccharimonadales bacterium]
MGADRPSGLARYRPLVRAALLRSLQQVRDEVLSGRSTDLSVWAYDALEDMCRRPSKGLRGSLAAAVYDDASGEQYAAVGLALGAVLELMQAYMLIVDDVMDMSAMRRGKPAVHELYQMRFGSSAHEAQMAAVTIGLLAQHAAALMTARLHILPERLVGLTAAVHIQLSRTGLGQLDDLAQHLGDATSLDDIVRKYAQKSGQYTFAGPLECGLILAGKTDVGDACKKFGLAAGVAFQLQDDRTDLDELGKKADRVFDDLHDGRCTWPLQYAYLHARPKGQTQLMAWVGDAGAQKHEAAAVRSVLEETGVYEALAKEIRRYVRRAQVAAQSDHAPWSRGFAEVLCHEMASMG